MIEYFDIGLMFVLLLFLFVMCVLLCMFLLFAIRDLYK